MALVDYFLKIDGIEGESTDAKHKGELVLTSFGWGVQNQVIANPSGSGVAGKPSQQDFHFTKLTDKASPVLFVDCATGKRHTEALLTGRKRSARGTSTEFLKIKFEDVIITSYEQAGDANAVSPIDSAAFHYRKVTYSETSASGQTVTTSFDFAQNTVT